MQTYFRLIEKTRETATLNESVTSDIVDIPDGLQLQALDHINLSILCEILSTQRENESTLELILDERRQT